MKFKFIARNDGGRVYIFDSEITKIQFFSLIQELCDSLDGIVELTSIPEAEIAKIILRNGDLYAKYDLVYGLDLKLRRSRAIRKCS